MIRLPILHQPLPFFPQEDFPQSLEPILRFGDKECVSLLKNCQSMRQVKQVHAQMLKLGLFWDPYCVSNLIATCALSNWGSMGYAYSVFGQVDDPGSFESNAMIRGYVKDDDFEIALQLFVEMLKREISPDNFTYPFVLKACAALCLLDLGLQIHGQVFKLGFHDDLYVQNSLISMYGKYGHIGGSCAVFEAMEQKSVASWSALITAHANLGMWSECLEIFRDMMKEGNWRAEESTLVSLLTACTHLGALGLGSSIHGYLMRNLSGLNVIVQTSMIDMYIKCGSIQKGLALFNRMSSKNRQSYSVIISGLAIHGHAHHALRYFSEMLEQGIQPDDVVYVGVLSACRHAGLVQEGLELFNRMKLEHRIQPTIQHYGCIVDLLGRAAMFDKALDLVERMPMGPNDVIWRTLLSAARDHDNLEVGEKAARNLVSKTAGDYIMMSNMYARAQRWTDSAAARTMIADNALDQVAGACFVEVKRKVYSFVSQDKSRSDWEDIYEMIHQMEWQLKFEGYEPDVSEVLHDVDAEEKRLKLRHHSQKLALAFALMHTSQDSAIRIVRNVRMCTDSHTYTKFISIIYSREIIVRDRNRFHHFKDGACSCKDYW